MRNNCSSHSLTARTNKGTGPGVVSLCPPKKAAHRSVFFFFKPWYIFKLITDPWLIPEGGGCIRRLTPGRLVSCAVFTEQRL